MSYAYYMAYLRLNRYQVELVRSVREPGGKPKTIIVHRFESEADLEQLADPHVVRRLNEKAGDELDAKGLMEKGRQLFKLRYTKPESSRSQKKAGQEGGLERSADSSMHTTLQAMPLTAASGVGVPALWTDYAAWRTKLKSMDAYAQAAIVLHEFSFLYRYEVLPIVYNGEAMFRIRGRSAGAGGVVVPLAVMLSILKHGPMITDVQFYVQGKRGEVFWKDADLSVKLAHPRFGGQWIRIDELMALNQANVSVLDFQEHALNMRKYLKSLPDKGAWVQDALDKVQRGLMRRDTLRKKLLTAGAPEFGDVTWPVWERGVYGLGPRKNR